MKTKLIALTLSLQVLLNCTSAYSCDCDSKGNFMHVANETELVVLARAIEYKEYLVHQGDRFPHSMQFQIIEVYRGEEKSTTIEVFGDNGAQCRPYISTFKSGGQYILALNPENDPNTKVDQYEISSCGQYWLIVDSTTKWAYADPHWHPNQDTLQLKNLKIALTK